MEITQFDRDVLVLIQLDAEASVASIAKRLACRQHKVRYALRKFERLGLLTPRVFVDTYKFGYTRYSIFFSLTSRSQRDTARLISELCRSENVSLLLELGGEYQFEMHITARRIDDLARFLDWLSRSFHHLFFGKTIAITAEHSIFISKQLSQVRPRVQECSFEITSDIKPLDEMDHALLMGLMHKDYRARSDLPRLLRMPNSTIDYRLNSMIKKGIVRGFTYEFSGRVLGLRHYIFLLYTRGSDVALKKRIYKFARAHPRVTYYMYEIGSWDYELGVAVENERQVTALMQEVYQQVGAGLNRIVVLSVFHPWKVTDYPFLSMPSTAG